MRRIASSNEFFDMLDKMPNGKFVTIGYVTGANLDVPTIKKKNPLTNRMKGYLDYTVFGGEEEIGALVSITSYNFKFLNRESVNKKYGEYKQSANAIRGNFGLDPIGDRESYKTGTSWSPNGPELYNGRNDDLKNHSYNPQNMYNVKPSSVVYAVNKEGHIIKALSKEQIVPYIKKKREVDGVAALRKMGVEEDRIQDYINQISNLKFKYKNFESNSILWIATTINGEKVVYINDNLSRAVDGIDIMPQDFRAIARERYNIELSNLREMVRKHSNIINEMDWRTYDAARQKAEKLADSPHITRYEMERRQNQARDLRDYSNKMLNKQYGIDKIKQREDDYALQKNLGNKNFQEPFKYTNGELKRLDRQMNDLMDYNDGKQEYNKTLGKWMNKDENPFDGTFHESRNVGKSKAIFRMTESELHKFIANSVKKYLVENMNLAPWQQRDPVEDEDEIRLTSPTEEEVSFKNNQGYSHFAISKKNGKILNGWDYSDYDPSELRQFKKDYFDDDLIDYGFNPKNCRILTYKYLITNGIDPDDNANWANNDEANEEFVG